MNTQDPQPSPQPAADIADLRDQILGVPRPSEDPEAYRLRSYQALRQAREIATEPVVDLQQDRPMPGDQEDTALANYHSALDLIATSLNRPLDS
ncbi:hypothetical protein KSP35_20205 [Aquihabitans sp. G128]|uniref:hypothetical protein n=1 Tax=Aquihabitans sp. G128 TaxID=2849779 RepID=UPI001C242CC3|nr:hypothetical protein [Aquihabitans sp. G128]QXC60618.1 hypothetical protein KSP35_20205 [Aquihabitans sp. G128]